MFIEPDPKQIKENFGKLSENYDRANDAMTFGLLRLWRKKLVQWSKVKSGDHVLDVATGTGDLAFLFKKEVGDTGYVVGLDLTPEMLEVAKKKERGVKSGIDWVTGDVMQLPFADNSFEIATISYGIRNVQDPRLALSEMARVVKPGGVVLVLETGMPRNSMWNAIYGAYFRNVLPQIGGWISGDIGPYKFLQKSSHAFPCGIEFLDWMQETKSFDQLDFKELMGGTSYLYRGKVN